MAKATRKTPSINWRTKKKIEQEAIQVYLEENNLVPIGYKTHGTNTGAINGDQLLSKPNDDLEKKLSPLESFNKKIWEAEEQAQVSLMETTKEGTRQDLELVLHHLRITRRYAKKAYTI